MSSETARDTLIRRGVGRIRCGTSCAWPDLQQAVEELVSRAQKKDKKKGRPEGLPEVSKVMLSL